MYQSARDTYTTPARRAEMTNGYYPDAGRLWPGLDQVLTSPFRIDLCIDRSKIRMGSLAVKSRRPSGRNPIISTRSRSERTPAIGVDRADKRHHHH